MAGWIQVFFFSSEGNVHNFIWLQGELYHNSSWISHGSLNLAVRRGTILIHYTVHRAATTCDQKKKEIVQKGSGAAAAASVPSELLF